jgi:hypothetical protein
MWMMSKPTLAQIAGGAEKPAGKSSPAGRLHDREEAPI